jgi:Ca2+/Na+ antiporter
MLPGIHQMIESLLIYCVTCVVVLLKERTKSERKKEREREKEREKERQSQKDNFFLTICVSLTV